MTDSIQYYQKYQTAGCGSAGPESQHSAGQAGGAQVQGQSRLLSERLSQKLTLGGKKNTNALWKRNKQHS